MESDEWEASVCIITFKKILSSYKISGVHSFPIDMRKGTLD